MKIGSISALVLPTDSDFVQSFMLLTSLAVIFGSRYFMYPLSVRYFIVFVIVFVITNDFGSVPIAFDVRSVSFIDA